MSLVPFLRLDQFINHLLPLHFVLFVTLESLAHKRSAQDQTTTGTLSETVARHRSGSSEGSEGKSRLMGASSFGVKGRGDPGVGDTGVDGELRDVRL